MVGGGAAATSDDLRSGGDGLAGKFGHVLGRAEVDVAPLDGAWQACVGHGGEWQGRGGAHGLYSGEHSCRTGGAIDADGIGAPLGKERRSLSGRGAVEAVALVVDGHHHQHGQFRGDFARGRQRLASLVQGGHGLDAEHIHASLGEGANLLDKSLSCFVQAGLTQRFEAHSQRADGACNPRLPCLLFLEVIDGLTGQLYPGGIDLGHIAGQTVASQPETIGAKGVGLDKLGAGLQVLLVNRQDQAGVGEVQLVVTAVDEDAAGVEDSAHGSIGEDWAVGEDVGKLRHSCCHVKLRRPVTPKQFRSSGLPEPPLARLNHGNSGIHSAGRQGCFVILR